MKNTSLLKKLTAIFLSISLTVFNSLSYARSPEASQKVSIPQEMGTVEESFQGTNGKTILYIQDAHDSLEAQENIAKIIGHLVDHYGVKTVYEEGYEGLVPTDRYFSFVKNPALKEKIAYFLMDKLRLGGAEYAHVNRKKDFKLIGADSINLHLENIKQYQESAKYKSETDKDLAAIANEIKRMADQHFPKELKAWMKLKERFDEGKLDLLNYLNRVAGLTSTFPIPSHISHLLKTAAGKDQKAFKSIDPKLLFEEISLMENGLSDRFLKNEKDRKIFKHYKSLGLLKRLSDIQLSPDEYELVKTTLQELKTENFARSIVEMTDKSIVLSKRWERNIRNAIRFYEIAEARDQMVSKSLDAFVVSNGEKLAIVVFGGFHKNRIQEILKQKHISYLTISPKITAISETHQRYYRELMSVNRLPFEPSAYIRTAAPAGRAIAVIPDLPGFLEANEVFPQELKKAIRSEMQSQPTELSPLESLETVNDLEFYMGILAEEARRRYTAASFLLKNFYGIYYNGFRRFHRFLYAQTASSIYKTRLEKLQSSIPPLTEVESYVRSEMRTALQIKSLEKTVVVGLKHGFHQLPSMNIAAVGRFAHQLGVEVSILRKGQREPILLVPSNAGRLWGIAKGDQVQLKVEGNYSETILMQVLDLFTQFLIDDAVIDHAEVNPLGDVDQILHFIINGKFPNRKTYDPFWARLLLDARPVAAKLIRADFVEHTMQVRRTIGDGNTAIYGGAGVDISTYLLSINAPKAYFIGDYRDITIDDLKMVQNALTDQEKYEILMKGINPQYQQFKFQNGFASDLTLSTKEEKLAAMLLELKAMGINQIQIDTDADGHPQIYFSWAYVGNARKQNYRITFVNADLTHPKSYPHQLKNVVESGYDRYYQRAGNTLAKHYADFIPYLFQHLTPGGVWVTDDFFVRYFDPDFNGQIFGEASFPSTVQDYETVPILNGHKIQEELAQKMISPNPRSHYGWDVKIRRKRSEVRSIDSVLTFGRSEMRRNMDGQPFPKPTKNLKENYLVMVDVEVFDALSNEQRTEFYKLFTAWPEIKFIFNMDGERQLTSVLQELSDFDKRQDNVEVRINPARFDFGGRKIISVGKKGVRSSYGDYLEQKAGDSIIPVLYSESETEPGRLTAALLLLQEGKDELWFRQNQDFGIPAAFRFEIRQVLDNFVYIARSA